MLSEKRDKAEQETGERKSAFINISADTETMKKRADLLVEYGWNYAMIDVVVAGTASVMTMRDYCSDLGLAIHAHRAMHATFDRNKKHGVTMQFLQNLCGSSVYPDPYRHSSRQTSRNKKGSNGPC